MYPQIANLLSPYSDFCILVLRDSALFRISVFGLSDERLKNDIEVLSEASKTLQSLEGCSFRWNGQVSESQVVVEPTAPQTQQESPRSAITPDFKKVFGFIAQKVAKTLPEAVHKTADGWLTVEYTSIVPVFIQALKEHVDQLFRLHASIQEIDTLRDSLQQLREKLRNSSSSSSSSSGGAAPSPSSSPQQQPLFSSSGSGKKRRPGRPCSTLSKPHLGFIFGGIGLFVLILAFGLGFGLSARRDPVEPPVAGPPITFGQRNFMFDGSFEDPVTPWWGSAQILGYNDTRMGAAGIQMHDMAPFNPGKRFALFNSSIGLTQLNQEINSSFVGNTTVQVIAWVFFPRAVWDNSTFVSLLTVYRQASAVCQTQKVADVTKLLRWQLLDYQLSCNMSVGDTIRLTFQAFGPDVMAALDWIELRFPESTIPTRGTTYLNETSKTNTVEESMTFWRRVSGQETKPVAVLPDDSFVLGIVDPVGLPTDMEVALVRTNALGGLDSSFGTGGVATIPGLLQSQYTSDGHWICVDRLSRILVVGRVLLGDSYYAIGVSRLHRNGSVDASFGGGVSVVPLTVSGDDSGLSVFSLSDDRYLVVSSVDTSQGRRLAMHRLHSDGRHDDSFAFPNGNVFSTTTGNWTSIAVDSDDAIYMVWSSGSNLYPMKMSRNGFVDVSFSAAPVPLPNGGNLATVTTLISMNVRCRICSFLWRPGSKKKLFSCRMDLFWQPEALTTTVLRSRFGFA